MKSITYFILALLFGVFTSNATTTANDNPPNPSNEVQRVRLDVTTPMGYTRHLLLGFTPDNAASDDFDYGYDASNIDNYDNDCNWMIYDNRYVIQGVGSFDQTKAYPLGIFLSDNGNVAFSLMSLENFDQPVDVYIYDALNDTVSSISDSSLVEYISEGNHLNRFFITFTNDINLMTFVNSQLSIEEQNEQHTEITYLSSTKQLKIRTSIPLEIQDIRVYSILGQKVHHMSNLKSDSSGILKVPVSNISEGTYIVRVKTKAGITNKRLIISK